MLHLPAAVAKSSSWVCGQANAAAAAAMHKHQSCPAVPSIPALPPHPPSSSTPGSSDRIMKSCTIYYKKAIRETAGLGTAPVTQLIALGISGGWGRKRHCCQDLVSGFGGEEGAVGCSTACWSVPNLGVSLLRVFRAHQQQKAQSENSDVEPHQLLLGLCSGAVAESTVQCSRQRQQQAH